MIFGKQHISCFSRWRLPDRKYLIWVLLILLAACKPSLPKGVISESKMVDVLYDYHLAQSMPSQYEEEGQDLVRHDNYVYVQAVFKKHRITEADFDSSMVFYCGDMKRLQNIFNKVSLRLEREASALGVATGPSDIYAGLKAFGDTANVWSGRKLFAIKGNQRDNIQSWEILCDSSWLASDDVMWRFNSIFLNKDEKAYKEIYAELIVTYTNDSVRSATIHVSSSSTPSELPVNTDSAWVPRKVHGYLFMPLDNDDAEGRLCIVSQPMLIRFHDVKFRESQAVSTSTEQTDSLATDSVRDDSLHLPAERLTPEQRRNSQQSDHRINVVKKKTYRQTSTPVRRRGIRR